MKSKLNNKGMSLIEILVTVTIVALVSAPFINTFLQSMKVDVKARTIQNGTSAAQDIAEQFNTMTVEELVDKYGSCGFKYEEEGTSYTLDQFKEKMDKLKDYSKLTGVITFEKIPVTGKDNEEFNVKVKLDPGAYRSGEGKKISVNNIKMPVFSDLFGSNSVILFRQYMGYDDQLKELFSGILGDDILNAIDTPEVRKKFSKSSDIDVECTYDDSTDSYRYLIKINVTYRYNGVTEASVSKSMEKTYTGDELHSVYMLCPVFGRYCNNAGGDKFYYGDDKINIDYKYIGDVEKKHSLYFYIAEQKTSYEGPVADFDVRIDPRNVTIGGVRLDMYSNEAEGNLMKVYTNIGSDDTSWENNYSLTYSDLNTGVQLYEMTVDVTEEGNTEIIADIVTTKE